MMAQNTLPHSLVMLQDFYDQIHAPTTAFDPNGTWENTYRCLMVLTTRSIETWNSGTYKISRTRQPNGVLCQVTQTRVNNVNRFGITNATINCEADTYATPRTWHTNSVILGQNLKPVNYTKTSLSGKATGSAVQLDPGSRKLRFGKHFTSNWSLFDVVQRLPYGGRAIDFDLLEELEKPRYGHEIQYSGAHDVVLGGKLTRLHGFAQTGQGIWDGAYWLDDNHKLLIASIGLMAFIYDPGAKLVREKS